MLGGSAMTGPKIERVIGIHPIGYSGKSAGGRKIVEHGKQFIFAEIAAVGLVRAVSGIFDLMRFDELVAQRLFLHKLLDDFSVVCGETWRERSNR